MANRVVERIDADSHTKRKDNQSKEKDSGQIDKTIEQRKIVDR